MKQPGWTASSTTSATGPGPPSVTGGGRVATAGHL